MLRIKPKYLLRNCSAINDAKLYIDSSSTRLSGIHKDEIKGGFNNHHLSFQM